MPGLPEASPGPSDTVAPVTETAHANAGSDASEASDIPRHSQIAIDLLHGRSTVGAPRVSPDGSHVACVVATIDLDENITRSRIWLDGGPVTAGPHDGQPVWSPDGRWLAFTSRRGEKKGDTTLHVMPVSGPGEVRTLCVMPDGLGDVAWSPDGRWIAFTSRTRDARYDAKDVSWQPPRKIERFFSRLNGEDWVFDRPQHVYVVAADGTSKPRNLTPGEFQHGGVAWLHDSSGIVTSAQRHHEWDRDLARDLYVVPLEGQIEALTDQTGAYGFPAVSPDGAHIAFIGSDDPGVYPQNTRVGVMRRDGTERRWISEDLDRTFTATIGTRPPVWIDAERLVATAEDRGDTHLYELNIHGDAPKPLTDGRLGVTDYDAAGGTVATTQTSVQRPAELWIDRGSGFERATHVTTERVGWEKFSVPCSDGSDEIDAWIMRPATFDPAQRYPVLLNVHGGPFTQYGESFFDEAQMQAAAGFVVVMSNPRGGSGRHTGWGQAIMGPKHGTVPGTGWGSVDVDDLIAVLDAALGRYEFCDPDRVGMLGGSYGGYMATMLAARYGDRFKAICSERAVNNLLTEEANSDIATMFRIEHGSDPVSDPDEYLRMSPIQLARDIHVPMLLIHSEEDYRCPINQAEELWMTLRWLGRDVTFYRFPGENHELSRSGSPQHRKMRAEIILDFFAERL
jgi:dipeptidyl aminopeptidase/acylaminoacyl peptidase